MKNKILSILFFIFIITICFINIFKEKELISESERRKLKQLPEISFKNLTNGNITDNFEEYALDHFILRDNLRKVKSYIELNILNKKDFNNLYIKDNFIFKIDYPLKENKVNQFVNKINYINNTYLKNNNVYISIIPEKNHYINDNYLKLDYNLLENIILTNLSKDIKYIDIEDTLDINSYYYTDIHWKQETLNNTIIKLSNNMNFKVGENHTEKSYYPFYGSYYNQISISNTKDTIKYLINDTINNALVKDIESDLNKIYEEESLGKIDSYDLFLGGSTPLIEIYNNNLNKEKELIIFRDSFASSLAPLMLDGYKKITLVDLRYMDSSILSNYIEFNNQDILFLYNTGVINNSDILKVMVK